MAMAFTRLRPLFRERGKINAEVTGRLAEVARRHPHRQGLHRRAARGARFATASHRLFRNVAQLDHRRLGASARSRRVIVGVDRRR